MCNEWTFIFEEKIMLGLLDGIWMKFDQILVQLTRNISNLLLSLLRRLKTSSSSYYVSDKIAIHGDLFIFGRWRQSFLIVSVHTFKKITRSWWRLQRLRSSEPLPWSQDPTKFSGHKSSERVILVTGSKYHIT